MTATIDARSSTELNAPNDTTARAKETTTLSPRFYTTDIRGMAKLSIEPVRAEWDALMAEFEADTNRHHFTRDATWSFDPKTLKPALRAEVLDFMVSSLTAEFSGCILYADIKKRCENPEICELMKYMARDESRHASFINHCLADFDLGIDMGFLAREKKYTYFSPKLILYATYLSEKIGYARYITIFRTLEQNPERRFHPIFGWFEQWCNDEYRHGEALALLLRANPRLLRGVNRLWIRFFQVAVFATMFVRDHRRPEFHAALGLDPEEYGMRVFRITSEISKQVFPVLVDVEHPRFLAAMRRLRDLSVAIDGAGVVRGLWLRLLVVVTMLRLLTLPTKTNELPRATLRAPSW